MKGIDAAHDRAREASLGLAAGDAVGTTTDSPGKGTSATITGLMSGS